VLPPWFGKSGEGQRGKRDKLGKQKCGIIFGEHTEQGVDTDAIAEDFVCYGGGGIGRGSVSIIMPQSEP
jgi:hypothetical protein